jgi:predicted amidophosphoribosyltransferase
MMAIPQGGNTCPYCHKKTTPKDMFEMACNTCGSTISYYAKNCNACGADSSSTKAEHEQRVQAPLKIVLILMLIALPIYLISMASR